ncbi:MAG TPA: hypothetical protein VKU85_04985 [bacterium]|nr:hypothetical protein [bacterium]
MKVRSVAGLAGALALLAGCSSGHVVVRSEPAPSPSPKSSPAPVPQGPVASLKIPKGHYPPPGQCRIWIPGVPPGKQPAPDACLSLHDDIPPGAWVLYRPVREKKLVEVTAYDPRVPKRVQWVRYYDMGSGRFVHEVLAN